jgi:hypothetical protein
MPDGIRLWRTASGDLVEDGHPDAVLLAYGVGDPLSADDKGKVRSPKGAGHAPKATRSTPKKK